MARKCQQVTFQKPSSLDFLILRARVAMAEIFVVAPYYPNLRRDSRFVALKRSQLPNAFTAGRKIRGNDKIMFLLMEQQYFVFINFVESLQNFVLAKKYYQKQFAL